MFGLRIVLRVESDRKRKAHRAVRFAPLDPAQRVKDLRRMLHAASRTPVVHSAGLVDAMRGLQSDPNPLEKLSQLPTTPIEWYLQHRHQFRYSNAPRHRRRPFDYHLEPLPRIAVLAEGYENTDHVQCYPEGWCADMEHFRPETLAGPVPALRRMASAMLAGGARLRHLKRPLIVLSGLPFGDRTLISDDDRALFWRSFGVPVFERYVGFGMETLAKECEAHDGLHLNLSNGIFQTFFDGRHPELIVTSLDHFSHPVLRLATGLAAQITFEPCRCGQPGPRLMKLAPIPRDQWNVVEAPPLAAAPPPPPMRAFAAAAGD